MVLADSFYYQPVQIDTINTRVNADLFAKEGDVNGRGILLTLTENGLVTDTTGIALNLKWEHMSVGNQGVDNFEAVDLTKGLYKITYPIEMLNIGTVRGYIQIIDSGKSAGIRNLKITIERGVGDDTVIVRSDSFTALAQALIDVNNLEKTYAPELNSVKQQLAETNAQVDLLNRGLGETFATLTDLQTAYPTGDTKDHIVGADGHRYYWNDTAWADGGAYQAIEIFDKTVTLEKTSFINKIFSGNIINVADIQDNYTYGYADGILAATTNWYAFPLIDTFDRDSLTIGYINENRLYINKVMYWYYDKDQNPISGTKVYVEGLNTKSYALTPNQAYKYIAIGIQIVGTINSENLQVVDTANFDNTKKDYSDPYYIASSLSLTDNQIAQADLEGVLKGKKIYNFGDSIAVGAGNSDVGYAKLLAAKYGMICTDYAVSGATMSKIGGQIMSSVLDQIANASATEPDVILFEGGANDFTQKRILGTVTATYSGSYDTTAYTGAVERVIFDLRGKYPNAIIIGVFCHSHNRITTTDTTGATLLFSQLHDNFVAASRKFCIPSVDMFYDGGLNTNTSVYKALYTQATEAQPNGDGTHPNELGYMRFYVPKIVSKLKSMFVL